MIAKKFVASYSGGKDSALAIHRAISQGYTLTALITTFNTDLGRSWFHGIPHPLLTAVGRQMGVPHILIETAGADYNARFEEVLAQCKAQGADCCVFGDIDIPGHREWGEERCAAVGMEALLPLWNESREALVREFVASGFTAHITVTDTRRLNAEFLGQKLSAPLIDALLATKADVCGENGEYHTFVSDGPLFGAPVPFSFGPRIDENGYAILPLRAPAP